MGDRKHAGEEGFLGERGKAGERQLAGERGKAGELDGDFPLKWTHSRSISGGRSFKRLSLVDGVLGTPKLLSLFLGFSCVIFISGIWFHIIRLKD